MHWPTLKGRLSWSLVLLVFILAVALALRLYGVNWDSGYGFHPDERDIYVRSGCMYDLLTEAPGYQECGYVRDQPDAEPGLPSLGVALDADRSPLNPHWFPLGSILLYILVAFRSVGGAVHRHQRFGHAVRRPASVRLGGRRLSLSDLPGWAADCTATELACWPPA